MQHKIYFIITWHITYQHSFKIKIYRNINYDNNGWLEK